MSGIAGVIHFDGQPVEPGLVEAMTDAMRYRGPDGISHWRRGNVALGQCMLCTTPESLEETQPLTNEDESLILVMDGRVDNWEELRRELLGKGAVLRTRADAELVLRAYEVWGEDCPDRIIGEFVFFIWDARQRCLFGARDAVGTRHFYYHAGKGWFGFASEIKGLLALGRIEPQLNESRLLDYLVIQFDRDDEIGTFYQGIVRLPAGHAMLVTEQGVKSRRHWNPENLPEIRFASMNECAEAFLEQLRISVRCRLRSIGPVGAMLSGGLDSSSIVGLISKEFRADLKQPLKTYSLIREDRESCPDWRGIREMLKDDWIEPVIMTSGIASHACQNYLNAIINLNEPFAFSEGFNDSLVFDAARESGCRVVLDGIASDLLFYTPEYSLSCIFRRKMFIRIPSMLLAYNRHGMDGGLRVLTRMSLRSVVPDWMLTVYRKRRNNMEMTRHKLREDPGNLLYMLRSEIAGQLLASKHAQRRQEEAHMNLSNDQIAHARNFTTGVLSFAHEVIGQIALSKGVEPRSPFSDRRLIEFAIGMPLEAKLSVPWYKYLLRVSMAGILPEGVRWRSNIGGHPGWTFFEQLVSETARSAPEIWSRSSLGGKLKPWIDTLKLSREWSEYERSGNYCAGFNILVLAILAQWLSDQFPSALAVE